MTLGVKAMTEDGGEKGESRGRAGMKADEAQVVA